MAQRPQYELEEIQRIMRKQLAAWCNPAGLSQEQINAVNEIIASSAAARYPNVVAVMNAVDLGKALTGTTITGISSRQLFIASTIQTCGVKGISLEKTETKWPNFTGKTIVDISQAV